MVLKHRDLARMQPLKNNLTTLNRRRLRFRALIHPIWAIKHKSRPNIGSLRSQIHRALRVLVRVLCLLVLVRDVVELESELDVTGNR